MKNISTNKLQNDLSKVIREAEAGEVFEINRYSKPVAYLLSKDGYEALVSGSNCKKCVEDLRELANKVKGQR